MSENTDNPQNENGQGEETQVDAAELFNQLAGLDSKDSDAEQDNELGEEQEADEDAGEAAEEQDEQDNDPWTDVPEQLRQQFQRLQQEKQSSDNNYRALHGRLAPLQQELEKLRQPPVSKEKPADETGKEPTPENLQNMSLEEIAQEWPEIASAMEQQKESILTELEQRIAPLNTMQQQYETKLQAENVQSEYERLAQLHPDYQRIMTDPSFNTWLSSQSTAIQQIAQNSTSADDASSVLSFYKSQHQQASPNQQDPQQNKQQKLADHVAIPKKGSGKGKPNLEDVDPIALFNNLAK